MSDEIRYSDPVLCYVDYPWCYFTTRQLDKQWGDDWDDAPYEHNAEPPYEWTEFDTKRGVEKYEITVIAIRNGRIATPRDGHRNSPYSVETINKGAVPWIQIDNVSIMAGTPLSEFKRICRENGIDIFEQSK